MKDSEFRDGYLQALKDVKSYCEDMTASCRAARVAPQPPEGFPPAWFEGRASGYEEIAIHCGNDFFFRNWSALGSKLELDGPT